MFDRHLYVFEEMSMSFSHFFIGLFVSLVLSCVSCLYILQINPLSVVSFANIFSHSEGFLFTLLIALFAVQKLLSLIRSHLVIDISPGNLDSSLCFFQPRVSHDVLCL